jgi:hypothetical protein
VQDEHAAAIGRLAAENTALAEQLRAMKQHKVMDDEVRAVGHHSVFGVLIWNLFCGFGVSVCVSVWVCVCGR